MDLLVSITERQPALMFVIKWQYQLETHQPSRHQYQQQILTGVHVVIAKKCPRTERNFAVDFCLKIISKTGCNHEGVLIDLLLKNYSTDARPKLNVSEPVSVKLDFFLARLDELNLRKQALRTTGWIYAEWEDEFLQWDPLDYCNITKLVLPAYKVWLPDISLGNSIDEIFREAWVNLFKVSVYYNGIVVWEPGSVFSTSCPIDITYYPFDRQECELSFGNWQYTAGQVTLHNRSRVIGLENYALNGEWTIEKTEVYSDAFEYKCCPDQNFPEINFKLHIKRKFLYYFTNIMIPCLMMSILVLMVFYLPPDAGEKISLGVTVLLSFSVFQLMIAENIPASANATPLLEIYLLCFMAASTFSVTISVFVLNLHHRTEYNPPPRLVRKICLEWLAPWLCLGQWESRILDQEDDDAFSRRSVSRERQEQLVDFGKASRPQSYDCLPKLGDARLSSTPTVNLSNSESNRPGQSFLNMEDGGGLNHLSSNTAKSTVKLMQSIARFDTSKSNHSRKEFLAAVKELYQEVCNTRRSDEIGVALENEWKLIARVVDRCFFIICTVTLIVSSAVIFGIMPLAN